MRYVFELSLDENDFDELMTYLGPEANNYLTIHFEGADWK